MSQPKYPDVTVQLSSGVNGNAHSIMAAVARGIRRIHGYQAAEDYRTEAMESESYDALLRHARGTVNVV